MGRGLREHSSLAAAAACAAAQPPLSEHLAAGALGGASAGRPFLRKFTEPGRMGWPSALTLRGCVSALCPVSWQGKHDVTHGHAVLSQEQRLPVCARACLQDTRK